MVYTFLQLTSALESIKCTFWLHLRSQMQPKSTFYEGLFIENTKNILCVIASVSCLLAKKHVKTKYVKMLSRHATSL